MSHEIRTPHERHHRHDRAGARYAPHAGTARISAHGAGVGRIAAGGASTTFSTSPRSKPAGSTSTGSTFDVRETAWATRIRLAGLRGPSARSSSWPATLLRTCRRALVGRSRTPAADHRQPGGQRDQVHRAGRGRRRRPLSGEAHGRGLRCCDSRSGIRASAFRRTSIARSSSRSNRPTRSTTRQVWRHGAGPRDFGSKLVEMMGGVHERRKRGRTREHLSIHRQLDFPSVDGNPVRPSATLVVDRRAACGPGGGRQRHQSANSGRDAFQLAHEADSALRARPRPFRSSNGRCRQDPFHMPCHRRCPHAGYWTAIRSPSASEPISDFATTLIIMLTSAGAGGKPRAKKAGMTMLPHEAGQAVRPFGRDCHRDGSRPRTHARHADSARTGARGQSRCGSSWPRTAP